MSEEPKFSQSDVNRVNADLRRKRKDAEQELARVREEAEAEARETYGPKLRQLEIGTALAERGYPSEWSMYVKADDPKDVDQAIEAAQREHHWFKPVRNVPRPPIDQGDPPPKPMTREQIGQKLTDELLRTGSAEHVRRFLRNGTGETA